MRDVLRAGADKVSLNTAAVADPTLIARCARGSGAQAVVVAIDARRASARPDAAALGGRREGRPRGDRARRRRVGRARRRARRRRAAGDLDRPRRHAAPASTPSCCARSPSRVGVPVIASGGPPGPPTSSRRSARRRRRGPRGVDLPPADPLDRRASRRRWPRPACRCALVAGGRGMTRRDVARPGGRPVRRRDGLVPAVVQDARDGRVLMVALAWTREALDATLATGEVHFHSRSRGRLWRKGETSGNVLRVRRHRARLRRRRAPRRRSTRSARHVIAARDRCFDTDGRARRARARQGFAWLETLWATIDERAATAARGLLHRRLLDGGVDAVGAQGHRRGDRGAHRREGRRGRRGRLGRPSRAALAGETADLLYHMLVLLAERGLEPAEVLDVLRARHAG